MLVRRRPNLLLLDEADNHLDLEMRHALTRALAEYEGSLVIVSHDRALLRTVCDGFLLVARRARHGVRRGRGRLLAWLARAPCRLGARDGPEIVPAGRIERRAQPRTRCRGTAGPPGAATPLVKEAAGLERQIATLEAEKRDLEQRLGDATFYAAAARPRFRPPAGAAPRSCGCWRGRGALARVQADLEAIGEP